MGMWIRRTLVPGSWYFTEQIFRKANDIRNILTSQSLLVKSIGTLSIYVIIMYNASKVFKLWFNMLAALITHHYGSKWIKLRPIIMNHIIYLFFSLLMIFIQFIYIFSRWAIYQNLKQIFLDFWKWVSFFLLLFSEIVDFFLNLKKETNIWLEPNTLSHMINVNINIQIKLLNFLSRTWATYVAYLFSIHKCVWMN